MPITIQDTYLTDYVQGFPGMLADGATQNRVSRTVEDTGGIAFGAACFQGTGDHGVTATTQTGKFRGVAVADVGIVPGLTGAVDTYPRYATATLLDMGDIWVTAGATVTAGAAVYVTAAGAYNSTASGNTAIPATFLTAATSGNPVRIRIVQQ